jgi:hypothetical protein
MGLELEFLGTGRCELQEVGVDRRSMDKIDDDVR